jgi:SAM-dependent methyltransferase
VKDDIKKFEMISYFIRENDKVIVNIGSCGHFDPKGKSPSLHGYLAKQFPKKKIIGVDFQNDEKVDIWQDPKTALIPMEDDYADIVIADGVLEHSWNPLNSLEEYYRILKSGGLLITTTANSTSILFLFGIMKYGFENPPCYSWNMSLFSNLARKTKFKIIYQDDFESLGENLASKILRVILAVFPQLRTSFMTVLKKPSENYEKYFKVGVRLR